MARVETSLKVGRQPCETCRHNKTTANVFLLIIKLRLISIVGISLCYQEWMNALRIGYQYRSPSRAVVDIDGDTSRIVKIAQEWSVVESQIIDIRICRIEDVRIG